MRTREDLFAADNVRTSSCELGSHSQSPAWNGIAFIVKAGEIWRRQFIVALSYNAYASARERNLA